MADSVPPSWGNGMGGVWGGECHHSSFRGGEDDSEAIQTQPHFRWGDDTLCLRLPHHHHHHHHQRPRDVSRALPSPGLATNTHTRRGRLHPDEEPQTHTLQAAQPLPWKKGGRKERASEGRTEGPTARPASSRLGRWERKDTEAKKQPVGPRGLAAPGGEKGTQTPGRKGPRPPLRSDHWEAGAERKMLSPLQKCGSEGCLVECDFLPWHRSTLCRRPESCEVSEPVGDHEELSPEKPSPPSIRLEAPDATTGLQLPLQDPGGVWRSRSEGRLDQNSASRTVETEGDKTGSGWSLPSPKSLRKERYLSEKVAAAKQHLKNLFGGSSKVSGCAIFSYPNGILGWGCVLLLVLFLHVFLFPCHEEHEPKLCGCVFPLFSLLV
nr:uncharacterized protein LOC110069894 [Pogona vitticeps]